MARNDTDCLLKRFWIFAVHFVATLRRWYAHILAIFSPVLKQALEYIAQSACILGRPSFAERFNIGPSRDSQTISFELLRRLRTPSIPTTTLNPLLTRLTIARPPTSSQDAPLARYPTPPSPIFDKEGTGSGVRWDSE
jgi:hypothetical protein